MPNGRSNCAGAARTSHGRRRNGRPSRHHSGNSRIQSSCSSGHQLDRTIGGRGRGPARGRASHGRTLGRRGRVGDRPRVLHSVAGSPTEPDGADQRLRPAAGTLSDSPREGRCSSGRADASTRSRGSSAQAASADELHAAPGNPGIARLGHCHPVRADDAEALLGLARSLDADLVVVGPEAPLVAGLADHLRRAGIAVFGPSAGAARIEGSKTFAKEVMAAAGVPTARRSTSAAPPCVRQGRRLGGGQGCVRLPHRGRARRRDCVASRCSVRRSWSRSCSKGRSCRCSRSATVRGRLALPPAQDFKRAYRRRRGPEHRWHGRVLARARGRRRGRRGARRAHPRAGARGARSARDAVRRRALRRAHATRPTARGCSSSTAASAIPRRSPYSRSSKETCSRRSRPRPHGELGGTPIRRTQARPSRSCSPAGGYPEPDDRRDADHGGRVGRGGGRARLPLGHGAPGRSTADERGPHPRCDGRRGGRCAADRGVCGSRAGLVRRRTPAGGHRAADGCRRQLTPENVATSGISPGHPSPPPAFEPTDGTHTCQCHGRRSVPVSRQVAPLQSRLVIARYSRPAMARIWSEEARL